MKVMRKIEERKGFTMIEILIVMAVVMILSVVGLTSYISSLKKSRDAQRKSDLTSIGRAMEMYANDFNEYPAGDVNGEIMGCDGSACPWNDRFYSTINGGTQLYMERLPGDPSTDRRYYYERTARGFNIYSVLENTNDPKYNDYVGTDCGSVTCNYVYTESGTP